MRRSVCHAPLVQTVLPSAQGRARSGGRGDRGVDLRPALRAPERISAARGRIGWIGFAEVGCVAVSRVTYDPRAGVSILWGDLV